MQPQAQADVKTILQRFQAKLVEADALGGNKRSVAEVVEDRPTPEGQGPIKEGERLRIATTKTRGSCLVDERAKASDVELVGPDHQGVSGEAAHHQPVLARRSAAIPFDGPAQPVDVDSERVDRPLARF